MTDRPTYYHYTPDPEHVAAMADAFTGRDDVSLHDVVVAFPTETDGFDGRRLAAFVVKELDARALVAEINDRHGRTLQPVDDQQGYGRLVDHLDDVDLADGFFGDS